MCHLLLALPLLALPMFWLLPLAAALPAYSAVTVVSAAVYWYALRAMKQPVMTGMEGMIGESGSVVEANGSELLVQIHNELWPATSDGAVLRKGDRVEVVVVAGPRMLTVRRVDPFSRFRTRSTL